MRVSDLRYSNILPNPKILRITSDEIKKITVADERFKTEKDWWKYERYLEVNGEGLNLLDFCDSCGSCCRNLPSRNIGMYMTPREIKRVEKAGYNNFLQGYLTIKGYQFGIIKVKENGDCFFIKDDNKCKIHNIKPTWCKMWACSKMQERYKWLK